MLNRTAKNLIITLIIAMTVFSFSGCRESMVIQEILYNQMAEEMDENNQTIVAQNDPDSNEEDEELTRKKISDSQKKSDKEKTAASKGNKKNDGEASKAVSDNDADSKDNSGSGKANDKDGDGESGRGSNSAGASENPNDRQITDSDGNIIDVPEDVNSVVVAGSAAGIVQMLGGKDILAGTSSSFMNNSMAQSVFGGEGVSEAETLWDGDGSSPMADSQFSKLLSMKPDVCVGISGETNFSDSQIAKLKEKKIAYVTLPRLNTADNIRDAVKTTGELLGDRSGSGGVNAKALADEYESYCDQLVSEVTAKTGRFTWNNIDFNNDYNLHGEKTVSGTSQNGKYTLLLSSWDGSADFKLSQDGKVLFDIGGVAVAPQGYSNSPVSYYMSVAGVCNNGARFIRSDSDVYGAIPLNINTAQGSITGSSLQLYPIRTESFTRAWNNGGIDVSLGERQFPAIVVDSSSTKNAIQSSEIWQKSERVTQGYDTDFGYIREGRLIRSYVRGDYEIYVNPSGVMSWTDGSVESVLESVWTAWKFHGKYTESEVKSEIREFYKKFYRYDLSDSELNSILYGN